MDLPDDLLCVFTAPVDQRDGAYMIEVPKRELETGSLSLTETYRVGMYPSATPVEPGSDEAPARESGPDPTPPVEAGERRRVEIADIGDQGDGIARVERGFVVIVPETRQGERVEVEITEVRESVAFAEVRDRVEYFE